MRSMGGTNNLSSSPNHLPTWGRHHLLAAPEHYGPGYSRRALLICERPA
jgi:hypothetical protein